METTIFTTDNSLTNNMRTIKHRTEYFDYQICPPDECTGCFACMNKCPQNVIQCVVDSYGRTVPQINVETCIQCGLCKKVCPQLNPVVMNEPFMCYAAQRPEENIRKQSASGGIGASLTEWFLKSGGVAYGAAVQNGGEVIHMRADTISEGDKFKCSKYVQSYIGESYTDVLDQLKKGKKVLFTGTPCQIAGLKNFLVKSYENLYCVDIICHGVPPMQYLKEHIETIANGKPIEGLSFRGGDKDFYLNLISNGKCIYSANKNKDVYYYAFMNGLTYRENCYSCPYARRERCSDLTIGDFWKLNRKTLQTEQNGNISVVLVNTEKGQQLIDSVQSSIISEIRTIEEAVYGNPQLYRASMPHIKRKLFIKSYMQYHDFGKAIKNSHLTKEMIKINIKCSKFWTLLGKIKRKVLN